MQGSWLLGGVRMQVGEQPFLERQENEDGRQTGERRRADGQTRWGADSREEERWKGRWG